MAAVDAVVLRSRGVEVFITYDDAALDRDGYFDVLSIGSRTAGRLDREAQAYVRLRDGTLTAAVRAVVDRTRTQTIAVQSRPRARFIETRAGRTFDQPRLEGLDAQLVTFGP